MALDKIIDLFTIVTAIVVTLTRYERQEQKLVVFNSKQSRKRAKK